MKNELCEPTDRCSKMILPSTSKLMGYCDVVIFFSLTSGYAESLELFIIEFALITEFASGSISCLWING